MTKSIWTAALGIMFGIATVAITAQQPASSPTGSANSDRTVTVTGCLKAAPSSATEAAGATGTTGATDGAGASTDTAGTERAFVLVDATPSSADAAAAPNAAGSPNTSTARQTYRLAANPTALSPHVGKKLELTGTVGDQGNDAGAPTLNVKAGKVLGESCSQ